MPKPGKALVAVLATLTVIWVVLAISVNWVGGGAASGVVEALVGNTPKVFRGEVWRLATAPLIHSWAGDFRHLLFNLLGLYFFGTALEERWGAARMLRFFAISAVFCSVVQACASALEPRLGLAWYGSLGVVEASTIAWALGAKNQVIRLFFVLPITGRGIILITFVTSVFAVIALGGPSEGLATPFGGMLAGYLFGDASPLRRLFLKLKLKRIQAETAAMQASRRRQARKSGGPDLRVLKGGRDDDEPPSDKRMLN